MIIYNTKIMKHQFLKNYINTLHCTQANVLQVLHTSFTHLAHTKVDSVAQVFGNRCATGVPHMCKLQHACQTCGYTPMAHPPTETDVAHLWYIRK